MDLWDGETEWYRLLILCVYYHHARENPDAEALQRYIENGLCENSLPYPEPEPYLAERPDFGAYRLIDIVKLETEEQKLRFI